MADLLDKEFKSQILLANSLIGKMRRKEDRAVCKNWVKKLTSIEATDLLVKKHRNDFFKQMLKVMRDGVIAETVPETPYIDDDKPKLMERKDPFMSHWSPDKRTYIAAKAIPGKGALVYMAVSKDPEMGWDSPGH